MIAPLKAAAETASAPAGTSIKVVSEATCRRIVTRSAAFTAVEQVFGAMAKGDAVNFPVVREAIGHADALYGFKSGFDRSRAVLGVKSGGYWPGNLAKGLTNHQSTVVLFDPGTGVGLQDPAVASVTVELAEAEGLVSWVEL